jgi:DNA-binding transcriptional regulator YiaG
MSTPLTRTAAITRGALTTAMLTLTAAISVGAGWLSFLAIRDLAVLVGWPADTAWVVQPIVELFLVVGSLEIVCRAWEGRTDLTYPKALIAAALTVVLLANVSDHVLRAAQAGHPRSLLSLVGALAALVPAAQLGSLHLISGRLDSLGRTTHHTTDLSAELTADATAPQDLDTREAEEPPPLDRAAIVAAVRSGQMSQELAATQMGRTTRTIRRWLAAERSSPA